jgi:hypothetical protein
MSSTISKSLATFERFVAAISVLILASAVFAQNSQSITVNCNNGQSLNGTLAKLNKQTPHTVIVQGTCTEYVTVDGFEGLTLIGQSGATIQQPATNPQNNSSVLSITGARGMNIFGLTVNSLPSIFTGIGIGKGSSQVLLKNVTVTGSWGVVVYEESQVWLIGLNVTISSGYAAVSAFDKSDVHIAGGLLQRPSDSNFYVGLLVGSGHVTMQGMTIRDMQDSININSSGSVDTVDVDSTQPSDVIIDNPAGTNTDGVIVSDGSSLNLGSARLLIRKAGQSAGGTTGAIFVTSNSTLSAGTGLIVSNSQGQGVIVTFNSHATLAGSSITGGLHGGLVAANLSSIDVQGWAGLTLVGGNTPDLFCDSSSYITGTAYLSGAPTSNCANQLQQSYSSLP